MRRLGISDKAVRRCLGRPMRAAISSNVRVEPQRCRPYSRGLPAHIETITVQSPMRPAQVDPVNGFAFDMEARRMLYLAVVRTLEQYDPARVQRLIATTKQIAGELQPLLGKRLRETPA